MANQIELGVDVDTSTVKTGAANLGKLNAALKQTQKEMAGADAQARRATTGVDSFGQSIRRAGSFANAVKGAILGFIGISAIRSLMDFTGQMQRLNLMYATVGNSISEVAAQHGVLIDATTASEQEMAYAAETADKYGQDIMSVSVSYAKLLSAAMPMNVSLQSTRDIFEGVTAAGTALGLSSYEVEGALNAIVQMMSKGSVQAEELRGQLGERIPGAFSIAAKSMGMTAKELSKALELGQVSAKDFVEAFGPEMKRIFGGMAANSDTATRAINELENVWFKLKQTIMEGGFGEALMGILDKLTDFAQSQAAFEMAERLGEAFKWLADNLNLVLAALVPLAAAILGPAAAIAALLALLASLSTETTTIGDTTVTYLSIAIAFWNDFYAWVQKSVAGIVESLRQMAKWFSDAFTDMGNWLDWAGGKFNDFVVGAANFAGMVIGKIRYMAGAVSAVFQALGKMIADFWNNLRGAVSKIGDIDFSQPISALRELGAVGAETWDALTTMPEFTVDLGAAEAAGAATADAVTGGIIDAYTASKDKVVTAIKSPFIAGAGAVGDVIDQMAANASARIEKIKSDAVAITKEMERNRAAHDADTKKRKDEYNKLAKELQTAQAEEAALAKATDDAAKKAGKSASAMAKEFEKAKNVLEDQVKAHERAKEALEAGVVASTFITDEANKLRDALAETGMTMDDYLKSIGKSREWYHDMLADTEKMTKELEKQEKLQSSISAALMSVTKGEKGGKEGAADIITAISDAMWGDTMKDAFDDVAKSMSKKISAVLENAGMGVGSGPMVATVGTGIATAAVGAMQGNAQSIGSGIGMAAGAAIGSVIPVVGTVLGSMIGSVVGGFIGGIGGGKGWQTVKGTAFTDTTYETATSNRVNMKNDGATAVARSAVQGTQKLLKSFNKELAEYVKSIGGTMEKGTKVVVNQAKTLKAITGYGKYDHVPGSGPEAEAAAKRISEKVAEIMGLAASLVIKSGPPLTEAQQLWRETQAKFSKENRAILQDLGFSTKQIYAAMSKIKKDLANAMNADMVGIIADSGYATASQLKTWLNYQMKALDDWYSQQWKAAKEIGASTALVSAAYQAQKKEIVAQYQEMLGDISTATTKALISLKEKTAFLLGIVREINDIRGGKGASVFSVDTEYKLAVQDLQIWRKEMIAEAKRLGQSTYWVERLYSEKLKDLAEQRSAALLAIANRGLDALIDSIEKKLSTLNDTLNTLTGQRSDVLAELTRRSEAARSAEEALAEARKGLAVSTLAPGGPLDLLASMKAQFGDAIARAKGGDAGAAQEAASLAQSLLQQGQAVYGSSGAYASLFRDVNTALTNAQSGAGSVAAAIEKQLDKQTFSDLTKQSTEALLKALGTLNASIKSVEAQIAAQTKAQALAEAKRKVAA